MRKLLFLCMACLMALTMRAQRCAVLDFQVGSGVTAEDIEGISYIFRSNFYPTGYTMLERGMINRAIEKAGFDPTDMTRQQILRVGRSLDASLIVVGTMNKYMDEYSVDILAINVSTGTTVVNEGATFERTDYRASMQNAAKKLAAKLAPSSTAGGTSQSTLGSAAAPASQPERSEPYVIYGYLKVFPKDLGTFSAEPKTVIAKLNQSQQYGYGTWRLPTNEELALMRDNNTIGRGNYMTRENKSGIVRLVTDREKGEMLPTVPAGYVDLGLPSGTLWKEKNESGFYTYDEAVSRFGSSLPTWEEVSELKAECQWTWTGSGYKVTGPNGNSMVLPASGVRNNQSWYITYDDVGIPAGGVGFAGIRGYYCLGGVNDLYFNSREVNMHSGGRDYWSMSVRLVQDK